MNSTLILHHFHKHHAFTQIQNLQWISFTFRVNSVSIKNKTMLKTWCLILILIGLPVCFWQIYLLLYRKVTINVTHIYLNISFHSLYALIPHIANKGPPPFSNRAFNRKCTIINDLLEKQIYSPILWFI